MTKKSSLDEEFMDYEAPHKPKYTLTTTMDDGNTSSTSTITTSEPDALVQILKSAGVSNIQPEMDHDEMDHDEMDYYDHDDDIIDMEIGGCDSCGDDVKHHEEKIEDDVDMDVEFAPPTSGSRANSHDDMRFLLDIMDAEYDDEDTTFDNEPNPRDLPWDAGSMSRNTSKVGRGVTNPGDNKLAIEEELAETMSKDWQTNYKLIEVELTDKQKKYFGKGSERDASDSDDDKDDVDESTKRTKIKKNG